jgi:hypothetical protein
MLVNAIKIVSKSIFPIFFEHRQGNRLGIGILGTGFFIDDHGTFLTACHVMNSGPNGARKLYIGNIPYRRINPPVEIEEIRKNNDRDVFIGRIEREYYEPLILAEGGPPIGKTLCLCGYPLAEIKIIDGRINTNNVRQYYQPTFVLDGAEVQIQDNKGAAHNYSGFMTRDASYPGMSGGPIFDIEGKVWGMNVAHVSRQIPRPPNPNPIEVINGISIKTEILSQVINTNNNH